jgi:Rho GTPase-activating protein 1
MGATFVEPGMDKAMVDEVRIEDAYGVHSAASLIKTWYRELRYPIFPETSYSLLREQFGSPDVEVTLEDLENILSLNSRQSPLNTTSREILLRHLLPMLSLVAEREPENKMDSNNLAICFAMTLVCGSNQLEDAKMTSVIRRILQAAIDMWPQLRQQLNIDSKSIWKDIQPPQEANEYEDPLEEPRPMRRSEDETEAHRVHLLDQESPTGSDDLALERLPTLPPRPASGRPVSRNVSNDENPMAVPRRKPAPEPPRYSTIFTDQEKAPNVADSPDGYTSADSFSHRLPSTRGYSENEKKGFANPQPVDPPHIDVPKRKAVATHRNGGLAQGVARSASEATSAHLAHLAAQRANSSASLNRASIPEPTSAPGSLGENEKAQSTTDSDPVFRKPSWPASRGPQQSVPTLAKPIIPHRPRSHEPTSFAMQSASDEFKSGMPKLRTPSAGWIKRMTSQELKNEPAQNASKLAPTKLNLKKASVDDLRRIYEERASAAEGLDRLRRTS